MNKRPGMLTAAGVLNIIVGAMGIITTIICLVTPSPLFGFDLGFIRVIIPLGVGVLHGTGEKLLGVALIAFAGVAIAGGVCSLKQKL